MVVWEGKDIDKFGKGGCGLDVQTTVNNKVTELLNAWYIEIRNRNVANAYKLKKEIESSINNIEEDQNLLLYYSLLDFGYKYLIDNLSIAKNSFDQIEALDKPTDDFLSYYYNFYKAIYSNAVGNYNAAKEHYEKAENLLKGIPDEIEKAEFYYNHAVFQYHFYQAFVSFQQAAKAKEIFAEHEGYEVKIGYCNNLMALACTHLKEWELAEELYISAMDIFKKVKNENGMLVVKQNLGLMYAGQNLSELAIGHLNEVCENMPENYKAIYIKGKEHFKLDENSLAAVLVQKGMEICDKLELIEYQHHFKILDGLNKGLSGEKLEKIVLEGIEYFEGEKLWEYVKEYTEVLAVLFHKEHNFEKASCYFFSSHKANEEVFKKEALK